MADSLTARADADPHAPAVLVDPAGGGRPSATTYGELEVLARRLANGLLALGARAADRMVWCGPNSLEVLTATHAARKAGLVAVPLSYRFTAEEMQYVLANSGATTVVVDAEQAPLVASVRDRLPALREVVGFGGPLPPGVVAWDDLLAGSAETDPGGGETGGAGPSMIYTSGTTGHPKGAVRSGRDPESMLALLEVLGWRPGREEVYLTTGPLYHSGPLFFAGVTHASGGSIVCLRKFEPGAWLHCVKEHRATNTFSAPTQLKRIVSLPPGELARADLSSMRILVANAAPVPYALKEEIVAKLGDHFLFEIYGSTELGICTVLPPADQLRKPGSCGRPYGPIEVRVVDDEGGEVATGEPGELFVRTRLAIDGYHATTEELAELDGGWKSVGDVAYLDDEGYVHICDRKKDMVITGGMNVYPAEIEAVLHAHPDVMDAAVLGLPDDDWGETVHAVLQPRVGHEIDLDDVRAFVTARCASYKCPRSYEVRTELPRTEAGKLLKRVLRDERTPGKGEGP